MGSAIPGQVVLYCVRKADEQAGGNKPVNFISPWSLLQFLLSGSCLAFPHWRLSVLDPISQTNLFLPFQSVFPSLQKGDKLEQQPLILQGVFCSLKLTGLCISKYSELMCHIMCYIIWDVSFPNSYGEDILPCPFESDCFRQSL